MSLQPTIVLSLLPHSIPDTNTSCTRRNKDCILCGLLSYFLCCISKSFEDKFLPRLCSCGIIVILNNKFGTNLKKHTIPNNLGKLVPRPSLWKFHATGGDDTEVTEVDNVGQSSRHPAGVTIDHSQLNRYWQLTQSTSTDSHLAVWPFSIKQIDLLKNSYFNGGSVISISRPWRLEFILENKLFERRYSYLHNQVNQQSSRHLAGVTVQTLINTWRPTVNQSYLWNKNLAFKKLQIRQV